MISGHGDDRYRYGGGIRADFSSNVPGGIDHSALFAHLASRLGLIARYPEPEPYTLERELAEAHGLAPENVMATNGATEAIYLTAHLLARHPGTPAGATGGGVARERGNCGGAAARAESVERACVAVVEPTFAEYRDACLLYGLEVVDATEPYAVPEGCGALWCCNPNNPTGRTWERARLLAAADANPRTIFVVDQSYEAFTLLPTISAAEAAARPNVVLIHSMTKRYAVPGLRLGYLTASAELCRALRRLRMPWSVNAPAIEAGRFLVREGVEGFSLAGSLAEARRLADAMRATDVFAPQPTDTHFMLVEMARGTAAGLKEWLAAEEGILIRDAANFRGLTERHFRVAAQTPAENDLLIGALERWLRR
jgi:threonine-phosphate decarboxylase